MQTITKKMSELVRPEKNVRIHTEKQLQEFEKSVRMFGQIRPIVIDEKNMILAGNGLYTTLERMGIEEAECYQYSGLTENQKKKLMIADNKVFSLGIENMETLNDFLEDLKGDLDIPGFDEEILKQMVSDADEITEKISEYGALDPEEIQSIKDYNTRQEQRASSPVPVEAAPQTNTISEQPVIQQEATESQVDSQAYSDATTEIRKFVICPGCGEKVWL